MYLNWNYEGKFKVNISLGEGMELSASLLKEQEEYYLKSQSALQNALLDLKFWMGFPLDNELSIAGNNEIPQHTNLSFNPELLPDYDVQKSKIDIARQQHKSTVAT